MARQMTASAQADIAVTMIVVISFTTCVVLWVHERRWDRNDETLHGDGGHDEQLATLAGRVQSIADFLQVDVHDARDDSPAALQVYGGLTELDKADDASALPEMPALPGPATEPSGIPLQAQSALLKPVPVPRNTETVERVINIGGTLQTFRIPAREES
jgi:hypothetical protein